MNFKWNDGGLEKTNPKLYEKLKQKDNNLIGRPATYNELMDYAGLRAMIKSYRKEDYAPGLGYDKGLREAEETISGTTSKLKAMGSYEEPLKILSEEDKSLIKDFREKTVKSLMPSYLTTPKAPAVEDNFMSPLSPKSTPEPLLSPKSTPEPLLSPKSTLGPLSNNFEGGKGSVVNQSFAFNITSNNGDPLVIMDYVHRSLKQSEWKVS
jgi:hypothetical protein